MAFNKFLSLTFAILCISACGRSTLSPQELGFRVVSSEAHAERRLLLEEGSFSEDNRVPLEGITNDEEMNENHRYCLRLQKDASKAQIFLEFRSMGINDDIIESYDHLNILCVDLTIRQALHLLVKNDNTALFHFAVYNHEVVGHDTANSRNDRRLIDRSLTSSPEEEMSSSECDDLLRDRIYEENSWFLDRINQSSTVGDNDSTPNITEENAEVHIFIVDTGINGDLAEFDGHLAPTREHASTVHTLDRGDSCEYDALCDGDGHGTHVAGTAAGNDGYNPEAILHSIKVLTTDGSGTTESVLSGFDIIIQIVTENDYLAVANASIGGGKDLLEMVMVEELHNHGVLAVFAAGNETGDACESAPAAARPAVTVGATTQVCVPAGDSYTLEDTVAYFSNYGDCVDIFAPGSEVWSSDAFNPGDKINFSGTSMASPLVAGVASALRSKYPDWTPEEVRNFLVNTSQKGIIENVRGEISNHLLNDMEILRCENGYYESDNGCKMCANGCHECTGPEETDCTQCLAEAFEFDCTDFDTSDYADCGGDFFCTFHCPGGFYEDEDNSQCIVCDDSCETCEGPSDEDCSSCPGDQFLMLNMNTCADECPFGYYEDDSSCISCASSTTEGIASDGIAYDSDNDDYICYKCDKDCRTCEGSSSNCSSCWRFSYLFENGSSNYCAGGCPSATYFTTFGCQDCAEGCSQCSGPSGIECSSCDSGYHWDGTREQCVSNNIGGDIDDGEDDTDYGSAECLYPRDNTVYDDLNSYSIETEHPYCNNSYHIVHHQFSDPSVTAIRVEFDSESYLESGYDYLTFAHDTFFDDVIRVFNRSPSNFTILNNEFYMLFETDSSVTYWGFEFTITPLTGDVEEEQVEEFEEFEENEENEEGEDHDYSTSCEEFDQSKGGIFSGLGSQVIASPHPYCNDMDVTHSYSFTDSSVSSIDIEFDYDFAPEWGYDYLEFWNSDKSVRFGRFLNGPFEDFTIEDDSFYLVFHSDEIITRSGYEFTATPHSDGVPEESECETFNSSIGKVYSESIAQTVASPSPYCNNMNTLHRYTFLDDNISHIEVTFTNDSSIEPGFDWLIFAQDENLEEVYEEFRSGDFEDFAINGQIFYMKFHSDFADNTDGFTFTLTPVLSSTEEDFDDEEKGESDDEEEDDNASADNDDEEQGEEEDLVEEGEGASLITGFTVLLVLMINLF